jgi:predicted SnoaL-like aldol condensation-catalyzing enzyme
MVYLDEKAIQQLINAFNQRDLEPGAKLFAEDVILHYSGKNRISGDHLGKTGLLDFWKKQIELTGGSFKGEILSVLQGEGNLVLVMNATAEVNEQSYSWRRINHYRIAEGRVVEGWIYEGDQYTADIVFA